MDIDVNSFQSAMTALARASEQVDKMCISLRNTTATAKESNQYKKFQRCCNEIDREIAALETIKKTMWSGVATLQKMVRVLQELDRN